MKRFLFVVIIFLIDIPFSIESCSFNSELYVKAYDTDNSQIPVAVSGVPYLICRNPREPFEACDFTQDKWAITNKISQSHWLMFVKNPSEQNFLYELILCKSGKNLSQGNFVLLTEHPASNEPRVVKIGLNTDISANREFLTCDTDDTKSVFLRKKTSDTTHTKWYLKSVYDIERELGNASLKNILRLIPLTSSLSGSKLRISPEQIQCLYSLVNKSGTLTFHASNTENFVVSTPGSFYEKGIFISAADSTEIAVYHLKNYYVGVGENQRDAQNKTNVISATKPVTVSPGKTLFIKAIPPLPADTIPLTNVEIKAQGKGIGHSSTDQSVVLEEVFSKETHIRPGYIIKVKENHISVNYSNKNSITNPGSAAQVAESSAEVIATKFGDEGVKIADRVAQGFENLGQSIETSSENVSKALITGSENLSVGLFISASSLANSLTFASKTFRLSLNTLSRSIENSSLNLREGTKSLSLALTSASQVVANSLTDSSEILGDSLEEASKAFNDAFTEISKALTCSSENLSNSLDRASERFLSGMECVEKAANKLANTKLTHRLALNTMFRIGN